MLGVVTAARLPNPCASQEAKELAKAMEQKEFRDSLFQYMQEISDPANRAEQEGAQPLASYTSSTCRQLPPLACEPSSQAYIRQLEQEGETPADKQLIHPAPGFALEARTRSGTSGLHCVRPHPRHGARARPFLQCAGERVFLNVVCSDTVDKPSMGLGKDTDADAGRGNPGSKPREGIVLTLPHIVGPPRREKAPGELGGGVVDALPLLSF